MVEVFKTNVTTNREANMLAELIARAFPGAKVNFDIEDCDHILRIEMKSGFINPVHVIEFIRDWSFHAEVLLDEVHRSSHPVSPFFNINPKVA